MTKDKKHKHIIFPDELIQRIENCPKVPKYHDFTTKLFMIIEMGLKDEVPPKNLEAHVSQSAPFQFTRVSLATWGKSISRPGAKTA